MNILVVHEVSYLDKPVYEYQDFPERLASQGHNVTIIDFVENGTFTKGARRVSRTGLAEVTLCSIPHSDFPVLKYVQAQAAYIHMLRDMLDQNKVDIIFLYSVFVNGVSTVMMAGKRGVPVIYRAIDVYHKLRQGSIVQSLLRLGESYIYNRADRILATNEKMADYVRNYIRDGQTDLDVLDHGVDTKHFTPMLSHNNLRNRHGFCEDDNVVVFLGTTYAFSRLDEFVKMIPDYLKKQPRFRLLIVGAGELDGEIRQEIARQSLESVVFPVGMIDYQDLPKYLSMSVLAINTFSINDVTRDIVPIKILQYLAAGLPVVSTPLPDVCRKVPDSVSGVFYSKTDSLKHVFEKMDDLLEHEIERTGASKRARDFALHNFSIDKTLDNLMANFDQLVVR